MNHDKISSVLCKLSRNDRERLANCINHAITKAQYTFTELVPILIDGNHQISSADAERIKRAIRPLRNDDFPHLLELLER